MNTFLNKSDFQDDGIGKVPMYQGKGTFRRRFSFLGVGVMIAVGYMDPGNWATDIAGGAFYNYQLLFVIACSSVMAMLLQYLALKLGIATDKDLAQACRAYLPRHVNYGFWVLCELAIIACDMAELLGTALALKLLFNIPLLIGVMITLGDVFFILYLQGKGFRKLEIVVLSLVVVVFACFGYEIMILQPPIRAVIEGLIPRTQIVTDVQMLFISVGILGATVMPHNLYLHSSIVKTRDYTRTEAGRKQALSYATWDSCVSLFIAFFINAAILILSATVFYGHRPIEHIEDAYHLLSPMLDDRWASMAFGVALLCAGQSSTITGTLAGQVVMEGFLHLRMSRWKRRLITRLLAVVPAALTIALAGEDSTSELLILSQVILSMQLGFAVIPLVHYTSSKVVMGPFRNGFVLRVCAWLVGGVICLLNGYLLFHFLVG